VDIRLCDIGEFGLIKILAEGFGAKPSERLIVSIGDDTAAISLGGETLLFTTDALVEGIHFNLDISSFYDVGWRAMASNISDIASMGGSPLWALVTVALRKEILVDRIKDLYRGMKEIADEFGVQIAGGDTVSSPGPIFINIAMIGVCKGKPITRSGARVGDAIFVTGDLGGSAAGLRYLLSRGMKEGDMEWWAKGIVSRHLFPTPRVKEGMKLAEMGITAMTDISDGLASELINISEMSGVGMLIYADSIPISEETRAWAEISNTDPLDLALFGGEDYELVFTAPSGLTETLESFKDMAPIRRIGLVDGSKSIRILFPDGSERTIERRGYEHFVEDGP
jgi:thiamine-monophosphate kinase